MKFTGIDTTVGRSDMTHDGHELTLHGMDNLLRRKILRLIEHRPHNTQLGVQLVNLPVGFDAQVILRDPHPITQRGLSLISSLSIYLFQCISCQKADANY